jgi:hypothetical protein
MSPLSDAIYVPGCSPAINPDARVARPMQHANDIDDCWMYDVVDEVGEPQDLRAAHAVGHRPKALRRFTEDGQRRFDVIEEAPRC